MDNIKPIDYITPPIFTSHCFTIIYIPSPTTLLSNSQLHMILLSNYLSFRHYDLYDIINLDIYSFYPWILCIFYYYPIIFFILPCFGSVYYSIGILILMSTVTDWGSVLNSINPYSWGAVGMGLAVAFSILGAAWYVK